MALPSLAPHRSSASPWRPVEAELDAWASSGRVAQFWWRDDDAVAPSAALDRLLALAGDRPVTLAVIPHGADPALPRRLDGITSIVVAQHGIGHENHAPPGEKRAELGFHRPLDTMMMELIAARARLADLFGDRMLPVLVPPWNRIAPALVARLPECGFTGLSSFGARPDPVAASRLVHINTHVDPVDWARRRARPEAEIAAGLAGHLAAQRLGLADAAEPVGLLTHHRLDDPGLEALIGDLVAVLSGHPAARWVGLAAAL